MRVEGAVVLRGGAGPTLGVKELKLNPPRCEGWRQGERAGVGARWRYCGMMNKGGRLGAGLLTFGGAFG